MQITDKMLHVQEVTSDCMDKILACFKPGAKITVVVRFPDLPERDFMMTSDDPDGAIAAIERRKASGPTVEAKP